MNHAIITRWVCSAPEPQVHWYSIAELRDIVAGKIAIPALYNNPVLFSNYLTKFGEVSRLAQYIKLDPQYRSVHEAGAKTSYSIVLFDTHDRLQGYNNVVKISPSWAEMQALQAELRALLQTTRDVVTIATELPITDIDPRTAF